MEAGDLNIKLKTCDSQHLFSVRVKLWEDRHYNYADNPPYIIVIDYADNPPSIVIDVEVTLSAAGEQR